jgi:serralysin
MQSWDDVVAVSFQESNINDADITFGNLASAPTTQAYAYIPRPVLTSNPAINAQIVSLGGDVWVSASQASNFQLDEGRYGLQTLAHEIGHALGISHPGGYNAAPGLSITYGANAEYAQDTRAYSIMSYFEASSLGARHFDFHLSTTAYAGAPLIHDIAAAQRIYGADMTTRTGDTVYGFNSTAGRDAFDFVATPAPIGAIWDAGGIDTLDTSGFATTQLIDLRAGSLSSIGGVTYDTAPTLAQVNANRAAAGITTLVSQATYNANMAALQANPTVGRLTDNFGIAYGVTIENAIGGSGADTMFGNEVANVLTGNAGNDTLSGLDGDDTLNGGVGDDSLNGGNGSDNLNGGDGVDSLNGGNGSDNLTGGNGVDTLVGGDGVDFFSGGLGNDIFIGEINATKVGSKTGDVSLDVILDFAAGDVLDLSGIDANTLVDGNQAFTLVNGAKAQNAGELAIRTFGNMNAAENALGMELDGLDAPNMHSGKVTVVFGNVDGGEHDFAIVFVDNTPLTTADFMM